MMVKRAKSISIGGERFVERKSKDRDADRWREVGINTSQGFVELVDEGRGLSLEVGELVREEDGMVGFGGLFFNPRFVGNEDARSSGTRSLRIPH
jgi:hypothetical protein